MDAQLWQIRGKRLTKLRRPDLPQLARAIVDAEQGRADIRTGVVRNVRFVNLRLKGSYDVLVRGEDWDKLVPFFRNSSNSFDPVFLDPLPPDPVLSPQPNRTHAPIRESASGGQEFLDRFPYQTQRDINNLLTTTVITTLDAPALPSRTLDNHRPGPQVNPPVPPPPNLAPEPASELDMRDKQFYDSVLNLLLELFPEDFPTSAL